MREELVQFIQSPSRETYLAFREKVISSDEYQPYSDEVDRAGKLYAEEKLEEARDAIQGGMRNLILSPRAHQLLGLLNHKLGDEKSAQMEMMIGYACLEGIFATGDGSSEKPYIVVRTSDEHDIIEHFEKELKQQSLVRSGDKHLDRIECTDGSEYWFDITDAYNHLSQSFGE